MKPFLIVNPASANGRTGRHFDAIARAVRSEVGDFECAFTRARGDGARLAREALAAGGKLLVAVGGDGTASEVVDGISGEGGARGDPEVTFGFIPRGTGGDLKRSIGLGGDVGEAARALRRGGVASLDLGRAELTRPGGGREVRHFANVAGCGVAGRVVELAEGGLKLPSGRLTFMVASARALLAWSDVPVRFRADGGPWRARRVTSISVCNGRFFGGGMMVAPAARMDDGLFDVVVWSGFGLSDFLTKKAKLYDGTHVELPNTEVLRAREVEVEPDGDAEVLLDVDGEQPGLAPVRFTILPGALRVRVPRARTQA